MVGGRSGPRAVLGIVTLVVLAACSGGGGLSITPSSVPSTTTSTSGPATTGPGATTAATTALSATSSSLPAGQRPSHFNTLAPGATLPTEDECAAWVRPTPEVRRSNTSFNQTRGHGPPADPPMPLYHRVTGNFTGTTDEILQWGACKWGIDEDIVRAQAAKESYWTQTNVGDNGESFGILQVRVPYMRWAFNDDVGDAKTSTAYNIDASLAARRNCFEGNEPWLNTTDRGREYAAGDIWGCVGMWFSGRWYTSDSVTYIDAVQDYLKNKVWSTRDFLNYSG